MGALKIKLRSTSMENGVSGCRVRRACRNDYEDNALGERATGRRSSSAHRGEPIIWVAKAPQEQQKSRNWSDKSVSTTGVWSSRHWSTAMRCSRIGGGSLLSTERCRSKCDYKRFLARPVRGPLPLPTAACMMNLVQQPITFSPPPTKFPTFSIVATVVKHWPTPIIDHTKINASTLSAYDVEYKQHHAAPPSKMSLTPSPSPTSPPLVTVAVAVAVPDKSGGRSGRRSPRGGGRSPSSRIHHRLLVPSASVYGTECAPEGPPLSPPAAKTTALPTTHLSLHAPDFDMQPTRNSHSRSPPFSTTPHSSTLPSSPSRPHNSQSAPTPASSSSSRGQIHVKLISARGLNTSSINSRPYVVVVFEDNEFVSRDPTDEDDKEVRGVATNLSRTSSSVAINALGAVGSKAAAQDAASRTRRPSPVSSSSSNSAKSSHSVPGVSGTRTPSNGLLGRRSAHSPVWKHEVSLYVASYRAQVPPMTSFLTIFHSDVTSEESTIQFNIYDRAEEKHRFIGSRKVKPTLVHDHTIDQWYKYVSPIFATPSPLIPLEAWSV